MLSLSMHLGAPPSILTDVEHVDVCEGVKRLTAEDVARREEDVVRGHAHPIGPGIRVVQHPEQEGSTR